MCKLCRDKDKAVINGKEYSADLAEYSKGFSDDSSEYSESRGNPNLTVISESGLYRILAKCNLPKCEPIPSSAWDFENETVWLTQAQLAELYKTSVQNVGQHIGNILEDEELPADSAIKDFFITAADGKSYRTKHYNLEMLIALGYRIRSKVATKFRLCGFPQRRFNPRY